MPISTGFSQELNPEYYVRRPGRTEFLDEAIFYRRDKPYEPPAEVVNRPIVRETIFMPDRKPPPLIPSRDMYIVSPEPPPPQPTVMYAPPPRQPSVMYATTTQAPPAASFSLIPALGLNADCPCWAWLCIIFGFIVFLGLVGMCLYFILRREGHI